MKITISHQNNLLTFKKFWDAALGYQRNNNFPVWPNFPSDLLRREIDQGLHFSVCSLDDDLVGYFSLALSDPIIWGDEEKGDAVYIHRMCVNPSFKGTNLAKNVLVWAYGYAAGIRREYIRMDTWATNQSLIDYYISCGFQYLRDKKLGEVPDLPEHYNNSELAMFQNQLKTV